MTRSCKVVVRCVRSRQSGVDVYGFFLPAGRVQEIAEICRITKSESGDLQGFQRPEIREHVRKIVDYLNSGSVIFPNALILALTPDVVFRAARGSKPADMEPCGENGTLTILCRAGNKPAWVVDGQQRTLALAECTNRSLPVPVIAFTSGDLAVHREQFILVNKAKPLSPRLIDLLLPEVGSVLPRDLAPRRLPSILCNTLNNTRDSPFFQIIKRPGTASPAAVVTDSCLLKVMKRSISNPLGALAPFVRPDGTADADSMYRLLFCYWKAVRDVFPDAWGRPPSESRLMHSAGIDALGYLMDRVMARPSSPESYYTLAHNALQRIASACHWTSGRWEQLEREWDEIEYTNREVNRLRDFLIFVESETGRLAA